MPGLSFLFKKKFHPLRTDNQKRVFIAEEKEKEREENEKIRALQVQKELELMTYEGLGKGPEKDPKAAALNFMYSAPSNLKGGKDSKSALDLLAPPPPIRLDENGDDEQVQAFKAKFLKKPTIDSENIYCEQSENDLTNIIDMNQPEIISDHIEIISSTNIEKEEKINNEIEETKDKEENPEEDNKEDNDNEQEEKKKKFKTQSKLEKTLGKRKQEVISFEEQIERHPLLKNVPVEGNFVRSSQVKVKPFCEVIRNVRCLRCGNWGHQSGDRECPLKDQNPLDKERQLREDPMRLMDNLITNDDYEIDMEEIFLSTLTRREKKLLLRKLEQLEESTIISEQNNTNSLLLSSQEKEFSSKKKKKKKTKHDKKLSSKKKQRKRSYSSSSTDSSSSSSTSSSSSSSKS